MSIVCIDTQILSWAIEGKGTKDQQLLTMARDFMEWINETSTHIIVPSIVVGELLIPVDPERRVITLNQIRQDWIVVDYDVRAAIRFAQICSSNSFAKRRKELQQAGATRKEVTADAMIIATAIVNSADIIYTHDKNLLKLAEGWIEAKDFKQETFPRSLL